MESQIAASKAMNTQTDLSASDRERMGQLFKSLRRKFPIDDGRAEEEFADMKDLVKRHGIGPFEQGVVKARNYRKDFQTGEVYPREFFPRASEIEAFIPAAPSQTKFAEPDCPKCHGMGMEPSGNGVKPCRCKLK
jgi:hypothetical protein